MPFKLECPRDLLELSGDRSGTKVKAKAGQLHRDGRPACSRSMKTHEIRRAARKCDRIHTGMMRVIFILVAQCRIDQVRRNFLQRRPNPKFLVGTKRDPQQFAVSVTHALRKRNSIKQWRLWQRQPNCNEKCRYQQQRSQDCAERFHSVTVIFPPTPRPFTLRSYMDCANTGGTMNWP